MFGKLFVFLAFVALVVQAEETVEKIYEDCDTNVECAENRFVSLINNIDRKDTVELVDGVSIVKKASAPTAPVTSNQGLFERVARYIADHEIRIGAPETIERTARSMATESRHRRIRKMLLPILLLFKLKAAIIIPIVLTVIALIALKGLGVGLTALALSAFSALKGVLDGKTSTQRIAYGLVQIPHEHWSRTGGAAYDYADLDPYYHTLPQARQ